jgi:predicted ArsR family transcriptional regulator
MVVPSQPPDESKTRRAIVKLLKTEGPLEAARLAERLAVSAMAVRQHLYALQREGLVEAEERPVPLGRPAKHWQLTRQADRLFPDAYAELNVALLGALKEGFGADGLHRLLQIRRTRQEQDYGGRISPKATLQRKLEQLAAIRTEEGYLASVVEQGEGRWLLVENHCPICAAASACMGLCSSELELFRAVLGAGVTIERTEHLLEEGRRCTYLVTSGSVRGKGPRRAGAR